MDLYRRAAIEVARRKAMAGDPFDFIGLQWPELVIDDGVKDSGDRKYFELGLRLDIAQVDILRHIFNPSHTECFIKGCTKYGKGFVTALAVNIWFDLFPESKIILTGPDYNHVKGNLFAEVSHLRKKMVSPRESEVQADRIVSRENVKHFIVIANPKSGEGFSGQHSSHTLFVFDEASAVAKFYYENAKKQARFIVALSNPRTLGGWFREGFGKHEPDVNKSLKTSFGMRRLVTADGGETVNVRNKRIEKPFAPPDGLEVMFNSELLRFEAGDPIPADVYELVKPLIPAQIDYARYYDIMSDRDENHRLVFGRGHFPKEDSLLQVVLQSWLNRAIEAWRGGVAGGMQSQIGDTGYENGGWIEVHAFGLDVATSSEGDTTVLAAGGDDGCRELLEHVGADAPTTCGWVLSTVLAQYGIDLKTGMNPVAVDYGGGYGSGVGDRLIEMGVRVIKVVPNKRANNPAKYKNVRTELWGELGARLDIDGDYADQPPWAVPDDPQMCEDMLAQEKVMQADGISYYLIPKDKPFPGFTGRTVKDKLGGRSPDRGDAVSLLWRAVQADQVIEDYSGRSLVHSFSGDDGVGGGAGGKVRRLDMSGGSGGPVVIDEAAGRVSERELRDLRERDEWQRTIQSVCDQMDSAGDARPLL